MAGDQFEKIQMAVDNLKQSMEDEYWVNMNEDGEAWLEDNAEDHGYVNEDQLADAQSEIERLKDENDELKEKVKNTVKEAEKLNADGWKIIEENKRLKKDNEELKETWVPKEFLLAERGGYKEREKSLKKEKQRYEALANEKYCEFMKEKEEDIATIQRLKDKNKLLLQQLGLFEED